MLQYERRGHTETGYKQKEGDENIPPGYQVDAYKEADIIEKEGGPIKTNYIKPTDENKEMKFIRVK